MTELNLPPYKPKLIKKDGKAYIFDPLRKKNIMLTPEEWVRQHFVNYLVEHLNYPRGLIKIEGGLSYNQLKKRSDILVYNRDGSPFAIVECKRAEVKIDQKTFDQAATYNQTVKASFLIVTNGLVHYCSQIDWKNKSYQMLENIPVYPDS